MGEQPCTKGILNHILFLSCEGGRQGAGNGHCRFRKRYQACPCCETKYCQQAYANPMTGGYSIQYLPQRGGVLKKAVAGLLKGLSSYDKHILLQCRE